MIKQERCSDLILLSGNPLENTNAIDQIDGVVANGKLYTREDGNALLSSVKN